MRFLNPYGPSEFRMRAAVFINAVAIRESTSLAYGPILPPECVQKLQTANYLFHSALNCHLASCMLHLSAGNNSVVYITMLLLPRACSRSYCSTASSMEDPPEAAQVSWQGVQSAKR